MKDLQQEEVKIKDIGGKLVVFLAEKEENTKFPKLNDLSNIEVEDIFSLVMCKEY